MTLLRFFGGLLSLKPGFSATISGRKSLAYLWPFPYFPFYFWLCPSSKLGVSLSWSHKELYGTGSPSLGLQVFSLRIAHTGSSSQHCERTEAQIHFRTQMWSSNPRLATGTACRPSPWCRPLHPRGFRSPASSLPCGLSSACPLLLDGFDLSHLLRIFFGHRIGCHVDFFHSLVLSA